MELLDLIHDYLRDASTVIVIGQVFFLVLCLLAILYGFGLLDVLAEWSLAMWPVRKRDDKIILPTAWNFNVNHHPVNPDGDHGFECKSTPINWEQIERNVRK